ncbi:spore gernimation protein XA [Bacillus thuringiensis]|uniref:Spore gernimation protein XA n=1 Tax=Bacillus thuringiensis TaxID=1428 RepID=A0A9X7BVX3_BACTU|nr:Ger(x)C family spore germination protein [Bacillus thuringiensis]PGH79729.1 spore gernimation protein XA [Bacillus thuringiensis]
MIRKGVVCIICCVLLTGCAQRISLEKVSLILLIALDKNKNNDLLVGVSMPLFHHEKQKTSVQHLVKASSIYNGFSKINTKLTGFLTPAKAEIILIGKNLAQTEHWINLLDSSYRDPFSAVNSKIVLVDGSVENIFNIKRSDKPTLPNYIKDVIESAIQNNQAVSSTVQQLVRESTEIGMAQTIPIIKGKNNELDIVGLGFFNAKGRYIMKIPKEEIVYFNLLNRPKIHGRMILHFSPNTTFAKENFNISLLVQDGKRNITVDYKDGRFIFNFDIYMNISLLESTNNTIAKNKFNDAQLIKELENEIKKELDLNLNNLLHTMQRKKIDPLGLTLHASAYQYSKWKKNKKNWSDSISNAKIDVNTHIILNNTGALEH